MYTKVYVPWANKWHILDRKGNSICSVDSFAEADTLLTHLNR